MRFYVVRKRFATACCWNGANLRKLKSQMMHNMTVEVKGTTLKVTRVNGDVYVIPLGYYFVRKGKDQYEVMSFEEFNDIYEKVSEM